MSPTARSLAWLRERGHRAEIVERWIPGTRIRKDLWGGDILAIHCASNSFGLFQVTSGANHNARKKKVLANPAAKDWLATGGVFEIHSWAKKGKRGEKKTWQLRRESITLLHFTVQSMSED
jgi:hypothetical protein